MCPGRLSTWLCHLQAAVSSRARAPFSFVPMLYCLRAVSLGFLLPRFLFGVKRPCCLRQSASFGTCARRFLEWVMVLKYTMHTRTALESHVF
jgi:hypothetical protein